MELRDLWLNIHIGQTESAMHASVLNGPGGHDEHDDIGTMKKVPFRLTELVLAAGLVTLAVVWLERAAWAHISRLRAEFREVSQRGPTSAGSWEARWWSFHAALMDAQPQTNAASAKRLIKQRDDIMETLDRELQSSSTPEFKELYRQMQAEAEAYLDNVSGWIDQSSGKEGNHAPQISSRPPPHLLALSQQISDLSEKRLLALTASSHADLAGLQRLLFATWLGVLVLGVVAILFMYRRLISPLYSELNQNRLLLERQEKLASLGVLATGIAHEIRNPLTSIKVRIFTLKRSLETRGSEREDIEVIETEINRLERIVQEFLQFARPAEPDLNPIYAETLVLDVAQLFKAELARQHIDLHLELLSQNMVLVDADKIKQVLINLVRNSAESISGGGTITLRTRQDVQSLTNHPIPVVILEVTDTGQGIPPEVEKRLFDPFFTTKDHGTGLGLPMAARILEKHGGGIRYATRVNRGTTFELILPRHTSHEPRT